MVLGSGGCRSAAVQPSPPLPHCFHMGHAPGEQGWLGRQCFIWDSSFPLGVAAEPHWCKSDLKHGGDFALLQFFPYKMIPAKTVVPISFVPATPNVASSCYLIVEEKSKSVSRCWWQNLLPDMAWEAKQQSRLLEGRWCLVASGFCYVNKTTSLKHFAEF